MPENYWSQQIVVITGGTSAIGQSLVAKFVDLGCQVIATYHTNLQKAQELEAKYRGRKFSTLKMDLTQSSEVQRAISSIVAKHGRISILINNAGPIKENLVAMISDDEWFSVINSHLTGTFFCTRESLKSMIQEKQGRIISISSVAALKGTKGQAHYAAAKAGMISFMKACAREVGTKNITCNTLVLGLIETEMTLAAATTAAYQEKIQASALKRMGRTDEVANIVEFMAGPQSSLLTGQALIADGGSV